MTFYIQGLNKHEEMPLIRLFNQYRVEKTVKSASGHHISSKQNHRENLEKPNNDTLRNKHPGLAIQSYHEVDHIQLHGPTLQAKQIMISPVISIRANDSIQAAMKLFQIHQLRHIPVLTEKGVVEGIISDRNILRHLSGVTEDYKQHAATASAKDQVKLFMATEVLTASIDTDVRYIARLFVERKVGAMPIVDDGSLIGMITRSDILNAVMHNFILELWV